MSYDLNSNAYSLGWEAWDIYHNSSYEIKINNPFKKNSKEWELWNMGWNRNLKGIA